MKRFSCVSTLALLGGLALSSPSMADESDITLIHTGDFHGHMMPRPNLRSDAKGHSAEGGLARIYTVIKGIRAEDPQALLLHTGDTIQGSAEVLYTQGQAIVDVVNAFGIDAFAPGNWEFVYGTERFRELFVGPNAKAPWNAIAANVKVGSDKTGSNLLPPYLIRQGRRPIRC
jgi:sulfur-oxidizing protein SoxB